MTRINTNVSSLLAQQSLANANNQMQQALTRLSTGLRINSGADDPAGLIASQSLSSNIVGVNAAITNSQTAEQLISTTDSALSQINTLLDSIRGLVSQSANTGTESQAQVQANQQQVDASLQAIDQIASTTQFQGQNLLDGSLGFTTSGVSAAAISGVTVNKATIPTTGPLNVTAQLTQQATQAQLAYQQGTLSNATVLNVGGVNGTQSFNFAAGTTIDQIATAVQAVASSLGVTATATAPVSETAQQGVVNIQNVATGADLQLTANNAGVALGNVHVNLTVASNPSQATTAAQITSVVAGSNGNPATINIQLGQTMWKNAEWSSGAATAANNFTIEARDAGTQYNGYTVTTATTAATAASVAINTTAKTITLNLVTGTSAPTTLASLAATWNSTANAAVNQMFQFTEGTAASGAASPTIGSLTQSVAGVNGGAVIATAGTAGPNTVNALAALINANSTANLLVTAATIAGSNGGLVLAPTSNSVTYNTAVTNGALQFTGPENSPSIQFVNGGASQAFSVNLANAAGTYGTATATIQSGTASNGFMQLTAKSAGAFDGTTVQFVQDANFGSTPVADYNAGANTLTFRGDFNGGGITLNALAGAINNDANGLGGLFTASVVGTGTANATAGATISASGTTEATLAGGGLQTAGNIVVNLATNAAGAVTTAASTVASYFNNVSANPMLAALGLAVNEGYNPDGTLSSGSGLMTATAAGQSVQLTDNSTQVSTGTASKAITAAYNGTAAQLTITALKANAGLDGIKVQFVAAGSANSPDAAVYSAANKTITITYQDGTYNTADTADSLATALGQATDTNTKAFLATFSIAPTLGAGNGSGDITSQDVGYTSGGTTTSGAGVAAQRNWDKGTPTGVAAELLFTSLGYGSAANVSVGAVSGTFATVNSSNAAATTAKGSDVVATINGMQAVGNGLQASVNSASLDMSVNFKSAATAGTTTSFEITGGGALFQLGPNVVANEQVRLGIQSVSTTALGGVSGLLYQLGSGQTASLTKDPGTAASIVNDATTQVSSLRAQLGAFQATTLMTNVNTLNGTLQALTSAKSAIQDADFAAESANITRAQILVQSGTAVLAVANQNPQNVLALLKNL